MNMTRTGLLMSLIFLSAHFGAQAARTITVNGLQISTGRTYELGELLNGMDPQSAFDAIIQANTVFVDFYAPWCHPCKDMAPRFAELAAESDHILFIKVNTNDYLSVAQAYGVQSLPTFISFQGGKEVKRITGSLSKADLKKKCKIL